MKTDGRCSQPVSRLSLWRFSEQFNFHGDPVLIHEHVEILVAISATHQVHDNHQQYYVYHDQYEGSTRQVDLQHDFST